MRGHIKYVSRKPLGKKPEIFSTGGYSGKTANGDVVIFDWCETVGHATVREDGHVEIVANLRDFDMEFTTTSSTPELSEEKVTPELLTALELTEVFYEAFADQHEEQFVYMDVVEFSIYEFKSRKEYSFQNLDQYNKEHSAKEE